jgi:hypothetical protein
MLNRIFGKKFHDYFHLFGISAFSIGLPSSKIILSISTMLIFLNLILEADFRNYWQNIRNNRLFLILAAYFSLHLIGLLWTENFDFAFQDIRIKLTIFLLPLAIVSKPLESEKQLRNVLFLFCATLVFTSLVNFAFYQSLFGTKIYSDIRGLSLFGSHIRYGILIAMGAAISLFYLWKLESAKKWFLVPVLVWFCFYTYYSQIISGLLALILVLCTFLLFAGFRKSKQLGYSLVALLFSVIALSGLYLFLTYSNHTKIDFSNLEAATPFGNTYTHNTNQNTFVNGSPIFTYLCEEELKKSWNELSALNYDSLDNRNQPLRITLIRYMTTKGLRKDGKDFKKLTPKDIQFIENGVASVQETKTGFPARFEGIKFQLNNSHNPNGHSLLQRLEFWKTGWAITKKNWLIGVGTGDVQDAFDKQYAFENSALLPINRLRAHNAYLTNWISFGVIGLLLFLWMNVAFFVENYKTKSILPILFCIVAMTTFLIEDTLETQMGASFFAFFYALFLSKKQFLNEN